MNINFMGFDVDIMGILNIANDVLVAGLSHMTPMTSICFRWLAQPPIGRCGRGCSVKLRGRQDRLFSQREHIWLWVKLGDKT